jgi:release factor glutamine methyltransferase
LPPIDPPLTVGAAIRNTRLALERSRSTSPRLDAELLVGHVLSRTRTQLIARPEHVLTAAETAELDRVVNRRLSGTPVAYLTGHRDFMNLTLDVGPGALVPRPETETLVEWAVAFLRSQPRERRQIVVDVGTGTGAIALSLADLLPDRDLRIVASDVSPAALRWAERNRQSHGLESKVDLVLGDLVTWLGSPITLLLANLPYLRPDQFRGNWEIGDEPEVALVSGNDGLDAIQRLLEDSNRVLASPGAIGLEIDPSQSRTVAGLMADLLPGVEATVLQDLSGHDRFVIGMRG